MDGRNSKVEKQVLRLYMFAHEIVLPVICAFVVNNVFDRAACKDLSDFLQMNMHPIYHLMAKVKCCKCENPPMTSKSGCKITITQLKKLYSVGKLKKEHLIKSDDNSIIQQCMCGLSVKSGCSLKQLDISLICALLKECPVLQQNHMEWLDHIMNQRNKLCHMNDFSQLSESFTKTMWSNLERASVGLATDVPPYPDYKESIEKQIKFLKIADYSLDDIRPVIDAMKTEWKDMQSEQNNNLNGYLQQQSEKLEKHCSELHEKSEKQRSLDKEETHGKILESTSAISAEVAAYKSEGKSYFENHTKVIKRSLDAMHKDIDIIKGNTMVYIINQTKFDVELSSNNIPATNHDGPIQHTDNEENKKDAATAGPIKHTDNEENKKDAAMAGPIQHTDNEENKKDAARAGPIKHTDNEENKKDAAMAGPIQHTDNEENKKDAATAGPIQHTDNEDNKKDAATADVEKALVELKIRTPVNWKEKRETIKQYFGKTIEMLNIVAPFEVQYVRDGCITVGTLLPVDIIKNEEEFKRVISKFLDQMVTHCEIDTSMPLVVKVKITVFHNEKQGSVKCVIENAIQTTLKNKAEQDVPTMVDQKIKSRGIEICPTCHDTGSVSYSIEEMKRTSMIHKAVQAAPTMINKSTGLTEVEINEHSNIQDSTKKDQDDMMLYSVTIKDNVLLPLSEMTLLQNEYNPFEPPIEIDEDQSYMLLMGCCKDVMWIESVLTFCKSLTPICTIENKEKSKKLLNSEHINIIIYIASQSSQRSHNLKSMLECFSESEHLPNKIITVVQNNVVIADILKESKQIHVKAEGKEWVPDLMDAIINNTGSILYCISHRVDPYSGYSFGTPDTIVLIFSNFKNVELIGSVLSKYNKHMKHNHMYEIHLRKKSSVLFNINKLEGIIYVVSEDLKEDICFHQDINELRKWADNEVAVLKNHKTFPKIIKGIKQIDATANNEDWVPELIDEIQKMYSMVYMLRFKDVANYDYFQYMSSFFFDETNESGFFLLIGNTKDVQWLFSALSISERVDLLNIESKHWIAYDMFEKSLSGLIFISGEISEKYFHQQPDVTTFDVWPTKVVTVLRDEVAIPLLLKGTKLIDARGTDDKWLSDFMDFIHRSTSMVYTLSITNRKLFKFPRNLAGNIFVDDELVLLMGNSKEVQRFYTDLVISNKNEIYSKINLRRVPARKLHGITIKNIIYIVAKSSKDEDFLLDPKIEELECWPNNVVTVVRDQKSVPNVLKGTIQIFDTGKDETWISEVMAAINEKSLKQTLGFIPDHLEKTRSTEWKPVERKHDEIHQDDQKKSSWKNS